MKKILLAAILFSFCLSASAQTDTYSATLKKYLEASGSMEAFKTAIGSMMGSFKKMKTEVPDQFWKDAEAEFSKTSLDELVTLLAPVYQKHLTEADLNEVIKFYNSPTGKKLAEKTPGIMTDSMQAGQVWGQKIGQAVAEKLKEKGY
jgi:uncharacterized protein